MKNITSVFSKDALSALQEQMGIVFDDEHDYSQTELLTLYDRIEEDFPYSYQENGEPTELGHIFEEIVDTFHDHILE